MTREGICRRSVLKSVPMIAGRDLDKRCSAEFVCADKAHPRSRNTKTIQITGSNAQAASSSLPRLHARLSKTPSRPADGVSSLRLSPLKD